MNTACAGPPAPVAAEPGDPLPGLTASEEARFLAGRILFDKVFTPDEGLGPAFNENQCSACHTDPAPGGTGEQLVRKATVFDAETGACDLLSESGGENIRQQTTPLLAARGVDVESFPARATERGRFNVPFLFGLGLVETIPNETLRARADPDDRDGDGISGRLGRTADGRPGRFGRKGDHATLADFVDSAFRFEMGMTTPATPVEPGLNGLPLPDGVDPVPEPEVRQEVVDRIVDYVRLLGPIGPEVPADSAGRAAAERGRRLFAGLGCVACHVPAMETGPAPVEALDRKPIGLYSDLLLHDMGPALANVCAPGASPTELRTEMLMGLRFRRLLLHDGRAVGVRNAVLQHGGEAQRARDAFASLDRVRQQDLVRFLLTL